MLESELACPIQLRVLGDQSNGALREEGEIHLRAPANRGAFFFLAGPNTHRSCKISAVKMMQMINLLSWKKRAQLHNTSKGQNILPTLRAAWNCRTESKRMLGQPKGVA